MSKTTVLSVTFKSAVQAFDNAGANQAGATGQKVILTLKTSVLEVVAAITPLEFDSPNKPFAIWKEYCRKSSGEKVCSERMPLDPQFLERLKAPIKGAIWFYRLPVQEPNPEAN